jgi:hypothetical protein
MEPRLKVGAPLEHLFPFLPTLPTFSLPPAPPHFALAPLSSPVPLYSWSVA